MPANGETFIKYGDLGLWNCLTLPNGFVQEAVFTEDGVDLLYYRFVIRVVGWITNLNTSNAVLGSVPNQGETSAGARRAGMCYTIAPRQHFEYHSGAVVTGQGAITNQGSTILIVDPVSNQAQLGTLAGFDLNNGPKCNHFAVTQVVSDTLFRVEAEFEICTLMCNYQQSVFNTQGILSNRWSVQDVVDLNRYTTRTITGKMRIAAGVVNPNQFRDWVIPEVPPGMSRISMDIGVTTDALWLLYTIIDREIAYSAPAPATSWSFEHTQSASMGEKAASRYGEVRITLNGDRYVDKKKLLAVAASIAEAKLTNGLAGNQATIIENTVIDRYGDDENSVTLLAKAMRTAQDGPALLGLPTRVLGVPISAADLALASPGYDFRLSRGARAGDNIEVSGPLPIAAAFSAYLQSPCSDSHKMSQVPAGSIPAQPSQPSKTPEVNVNLVNPQALTDDSTNSYFNNSGSQAIYSYYRMESSFEGDGMRVHCPIAVTGNFSLGGGGGSNPYQLTGNQTGSVVLNLAARLTKRRVRISAERLGKQPDMPQMQDSFSDSNQITYTLLDTVDSPVQPVRTADGNQLYAVDREYIYAMSRAPNSTDNMAVGVNPWDKQSAITKQFDPGIPEGSYPLS